MLVPIISFTLVTVLTPGPNNIMLLSSGLTFGYKRSIAHMSGIVLGFTLMVVCIGLGIGTIFKTFPVVFTILKILGISYLFWMAWHIANTKGIYETKTSTRNKPFTFIQAATFQWANTKAWIVAITAITSFVTSSKYAFIQVLIIAFIYLLSAIIACNFWTLGGIYLKKIIKNERHLKIFNVTMAILLIASVLPFIF
jgi:threonine/homoserine/homoserine lactone efflux protein